MHADIKLVLDNKDVPELHTKHVAKAIEVAPKLVEKAKCQPPPRADPTPLDPPSGPPLPCPASLPTLITLMILTVIPGPMRNLGLEASRLSLSKCVKVTITKLREFWKVLKLLESEHRGLQTSFDQS